jgi:hypothetical protein
MLSKKFSVLFGFFLFKSTTEIIKDVARLNFEEDSTL